MRTILYLFWGLLPALAYAQPVKTAHVTAELTSENKTLRPGAENWLGLRLEMEPHWHTYWRFPGDSGLPTKVEWQLPEGWKISGPYWPLPERIPLPPLVNYGYEGEALIGFRLELPSGAIGTYPLKAQASWLVCKEECIPEEASLSTTVTVKEGAPQPQPWADLFAQLRKVQPQPLPPGALTALRVEGKRVGIEFDNDPPWIEGKADFFPLASQIVGLGSPEVAKENGKVILWMERAEPFLESAKELPGILVVGEGREREVFELSAPLPASAGAPAAQEEAPGLALALIFAFLGGMLLNLMPCVFPVLGIKVMALVSQGGGDSWHARKHGNIYALGVVVSFWILTAALLALRAAGESVGWGFQLQQPGFVLALILLFSLMAASLGGFFDLGGRFMGMGSGLAAKEGPAGSFFTGMLAVVVATPCTAPFMGTAIGVVLAQPAWAVFAVFTALGLGLAAPFVVLSYQPRLLKVLPRPGAWMERLKELFAFPLAGTVLWLLWVFARQVGIDGLIVASSGLLVVFFAIWLGRRFQSQGAKVASWLILALGCLLAASSLQWRAGAMAAAEGWKPYSEPAVQAAVSEGKPVFIDFTAAWCLTCQVNKSLVLDRSSMKKFFEQQGVQLFRADWTNHDPEITRALERHGRIGVPLYLAYAPGGQVQVLPQVLTEGLVKEAFQQQQ